MATCSDDTRERDLSELAGARCMAGDHTPVSQGEAQGDGSRRPPGSEGAWAGVGARPLRGAESCRLWREEH